MATLTATGTVQGSPAVIDLTFPDTTQDVGSFSGGKTITFIGTNGSNVPIQAPFTVSVKVDGVEDNSLINIPFHYYYDNGK